VRPPFPHPKRISLLRACRVPGLTVYADDGEPVVDAAPAGHEKVYAQVCELREERQDIDDRVQAIDESVKVRSGHSPLFF